VDLEKPVTPSAWYGGNCKRQEVGHALCSPYRCSVSVTLASLCGTLVTLDLVFSRCADWLFPIPPLLQHARCDRYGTETSLLKVIRQMMPQTVPALLQHTNPKALCVITRVLLAAELQELRKLDERHFKFRFRSYFTLTYTVLFRGTLKLSWRNYNAPDLCSGVTQRESRPHYGLLYQKLSCLSTVSSGQWR
jgi:hypothetical protein